MAYLSHLSVLQAGVTTTKNGVTGVVMNEKEITYNLILDIWNLLKKYNFKKLSDSEWGEFAEKGILLEEKYKAHSKEVYTFYRELFVAVRHYYESKK
jgi:hypothetical protein